MLDDVDGEHNVGADATRADDAVGDPRIGGDPQQMNGALPGGRAIDVDPTEPMPVPPVAKDSSDGEFVIAPIPMYDPSQEFSLIVVGQYLFHPDPNDKVSPPSILAAGGLYTQQDSCAGFLGYLGYLDRDTWRVMAGGGAGRFNYNFYGIGNDAASFGRAFGGDFNYQAYQIDYNQYFPVAPRSVLAVRGFGRFTSDGAPFFDLSTFGTRTDLRGYEAGKYRDRHMIAVQAEYRYLLNDWIGLAAFAGTGEVFDSIDLLSFDDLLSSVGAGVRIRLAKQNPVYYRIDGAYGKDGFALYLGIGQAF